MSKVAVFHGKAKHKDDNYEAWFRTWDDLLCWLESISAGATHELDVRIKTTQIEFEDRL